MWWFMAIIPALGKPRQEDQEVEVNLSYIEKSYLEKKLTRGNLSAFLLFPSLDYNFHLFLHFLELAHH
jgi:hypothetical protein